MTKSKPRKKPRIERQEGKTKTQRQEAKTERKLKEPRGKDEKAVKGRASKATTQQPDTLRIPLIRAWAAVW
jgi:hypothetical protein